MGLIHKIHYVHAATSLMTVIFGAEFQLKKFKRNALHAKRLEIIHPISENPIIFKAPLPKEYLNLVNSIDSFNGE